MNFNRNGKIARLPMEIREQLNHRLHNHESGKELVKWLNSLPEMQSLMVAEFGGKPVREQNLSKWRLGGYKDWLIKQETIEMAGRISADGADLTQAAGGPLADKLAVWLLARYLVAAKKLEGQDAAGEPAWNRLREFCHDLATLRRGDHYADHLRLEWEKFREARKDEQLKALDICLTEAQKYPDVIKSYRKSYNLLQEHRQKEPPA